MSDSIGLSDEILSESNEVQGQFDKMDADHVEAFGNFDDDEKMGVEQDAIDAEEAGQGGEECEEEKSWDPGLRCGLSPTVPWPPQTQNCFARDAPLRGTPAGSAEGLQEDAPRARADGCPGCSRVAHVADVAVQTGGPSVRARGEVEEEEPTCWQRMPLRGLCLAPEGMQSKSRRDGHVDASPLLRLDGGVADTLLDSLSPTAAAHAAARRLPDPWREDPWCKDFLPYHTDRSRCTRVSWTSENGEERRCSHERRWTWGADGGPRGDEIALSSLTSWMMRIGTPAAVISP